MAPRGKHLRGAYHQEDMSKSPYENLMDPNLEDASRRGSISMRECAAMRLLARDGWTVGVLKMCFHLSTEDAVRRHVTGDCSHSHGAPAITEWDSKESKQERRDSRLSYEDRV